jgi:hypothetical protein
VPGEWGIEQGRAARAPPRRGRPFRLYFANHAFQK